MTDQAKDPHRGKYTVHPNSQCPSCGTTMEWQHIKIPLGDDFLDVYALKERHHEKCPKCGRVKPRDDGDGLLTPNSPVNGNA